MIENNALQGLSNAVLKEYDVTLKAMPPTNIKVHYQYD